MLPSVFYLNLDSLELQAERTVDPTLKTRPIAIISSIDNSGTIVSLSHEAKEEGLYKGMKVTIAKKKTHMVQFLPYNHVLYQRVNKYAYDTLSIFTPVIEPKGMSGLYMDMKGIAIHKKNAKDIGLSVIDKIESRINLCSVIGISTNKLISRIITNVTFNSIDEVCPGSEDYFLAPLNFNVLPTARLKPVYRILDFLLIDKIHQIQTLSKRTLDFRTLFGVHALQLANEASGKDSSLVRTPILKDHLLEQTVLPRDTNDKNILVPIIQDLAEKIAFQLRKRKQIAKKLMLEIHYIDGYSSNKSTSIDFLDDVSISKVCKKLFFKVNTRRISVRSVLLDVSQFKPFVEQRNLFFISESRDMKISKAIEKVRLKHGVKSIKRANVLQALG